MNQQSAQGLASLGRGPDSMLVHMAPGEVKSLQQLAMAHGGSLTINPETGLPEAGFLSSILPMIIGGGLTIASGGALSPLMAGLITGGGYGLATGSLKKGLMAGFGAYGGAGLGSALAGAGMQASVAPQLAQAQAGVGELASAANTAGGITPAMAPDYAKSILSQTQPYVDASNAASTAFQNASPLARLQTAGSGISNLTSEAGRGAFMNQIGGGKGLMQAGLAAAAPMLMETTTKQPEIKSDANMGQRYQFNAGTQTPTPTPDVPGYGNQGQNFGKEQQYFNPMYRPIDNEAARKMYGFASGGPVEAMSDANSIGMNTGYPQADVSTGAYATPYQQPISRNVVTGPQGAGIDPYTGQQQRIAPAPQAQFAEGGEVGGYTYDPVTQMYTKKSGEGATMVSPVGGISGASGSSGSDQYTDPNPGWSGLSRSERAAYYAENPTRAAITQALQKGFGYTTLGMAQNAFNPGFVSAEGLVARGIDPDTGLMGQGTRGQTGLHGDIGVFDSNGNLLGGSYSDHGGPGPAGSGSTGGGLGGVGGEGTPGSNGPGDGTASDYARGGLSALAQGGISHLGDYSDGGRLLRGPGDGISDSIPAMIGKKRPARLADGEFVVPARIVSELGNGSTEAGARKLYAMMDRVQKARGKTVGKGKVAANSRSAKYLPA
jgi:hypothetical protein